MATMGSATLTGRAVVGFGMDATGTHRRWLGLAMVGAIALVLVGCGGGSSSGVSNPFAQQVDPWVAASDSFVIRDCAAVQEHLSRAELDPNMSQEMFARAAFMRGVCAEQQGDIADAVGAYKYVLTKHPNTSSAFLSGERLRKLSEAALQ